MKTTRLSLTLASLALGLGLASTAAMALPAVPLERGPGLLSEVKHKRDAHKKEAHHKHAHAKDRTSKKTALKLKKKKLAKAAKKPGKTVAKKHRHAHKKGAKKL